MDYAQAIPSLSQAQRIKQLSKEKQLSLEKMEEIMCEVKKGEITRVAFTNEQLHKYFPNSYTSLIHFSNVGYAHTQTGDTGVKVSDVSLYHRRQQSAPEPFHWLR